MADTEVEHDSSC